MAEKNNEETVYDDNGNVIAIRAGGGHKVKMDEEAIKSLAGQNQQPAIAVRQSLSNDSDNSNNSNNSELVNPQKILVVRDMALGDIMMCLPLLPKLKAKYPNAEIHFATKSQYTDLAEPFCDKVFDYKNIDANIYDKIINLIMYCELHEEAVTKPRMDILFEGVGVDKGFDIREFNFRDNYLNDEEVEDFRDKIENEFNFDLSSKKKIVTIGTETSRGSKNWAIDKFNALIERLSNKYPDNAFIVFGVGHKEIYEASNVLNLCGKTSLHELFLMIDISDLVLTLETGSMHVAAFLNKPFIVICGPSNYELFTHYYKNFSVIHPDIDCYPCNGECETNHCIKTIGDNFVFKVMEDRIDRLEEDYVAIYPTRGDFINFNKNLNKKRMIKNIGILSVWAEQGLGYLTQNFRNALKDDYNVYIWGTFPMYAPKHAELKDDWNISNIYLDNKTRENINIDEFINWVKDNDIDTVIIMEPSGSKIWELVLALKGENVYTIGVPMIEITRSSEIFNHKFLDLNISLTRQCYEILKAHEINETDYIPYGVQKNQNIENNNYISNKNGFVFYFNAGWADERKNSKAVLEAFKFALEKRKDIYLLFHSQAGIEYFSPDQQKIIKELDNIIFSSGSLEYDKILSYTQSSDVVLIPTKREGLGILFLEALAFEKPIISSNYPPMNQYVKNNVNGYLCGGKEEPIPSNLNPSPLVGQFEIDIYELSEAIVKIADKNKIEYFSYNSNELYENKYSFDKFSINLKESIERQKEIVMGENKKEKIFFIGNYLYPIIGGAEKAMLTYLEYLADHGYDVYVLCDRPGVDGSIHRVGDFFGRTVFTKHNNVKIIQSAENILDCMDHYIKEIDPDLVISQLSISGDVLSRAKNKGIKTMMYIHSVAEHFCSYHAWDCDGGHKDLRTCAYDSEYCMQEYKNYKTQFEVADYILANSDFTQKITQRFYNKNSYILYPPVLNIEKVEDSFNNRYITFVNPVVDKGCDIVYEISKTLPQHMFLIVGVNDEGVRKMIVNEKAAGGSIATQGYAENINSVFKNSKLVLMPSVVQEGFGMIASEALTAGIPVLTSGRGGLEDAVGDSGIIIQDYYNIDQWKEEIEKLLNNKEYYKEISQKGFEYAKQFSIDVQGKKLLDIMNKVFSKE